MLQIVAIPVQDSDSTPGPLYSTIAPVPPLTVRIPATFRMTSVLGVRYIQVLLSSKALTFRGSPAANRAREVYTNDLGALKFPRNVCHNIDSIGTTDATRNHT